MAKRLCGASTRWTRAIQDLVGRDGTDRRRLLAAAAGVKGLRMVPMWAADPIRASNDASHPHDLPEVAVDIGIPDELRWIDRALASMERQYPLRALILRTEFTVSASQAVKARMVAEKYGGTLSVWQYRRELQMGGRLATGKTSCLMPWIDTPSKCFTSSTRSKQALFQR